MAKSDSSNKDRDWNNKIPQSAEFKAVRDE